MPISINYSYIIGKNCMVNYIIYFNVALNEKLIKNMARVSKKVADPCIRVYRDQNKTEKSVTIVSVHCCK